MAFENASSATPALGTFRVATVRTRARSHTVVKAGKLEKVVGSIGLGAGRCHHVVERRLQRRPALDTVLTRERLLHLPEGRLGRDVTARLSYRCRAAGSPARSAFNQRFASFLSESRLVFGEIDRVMGTFLPCAW